MMKKNILLAFLGGILTLFFFACSTENGEDYGATGTFLIDVQTIHDVLVGDQVVSRAETGDEASVNVSDFSISVDKQGDILYEWATCAEMQEADKPELRPAVYTAKAWWGDLASEGFDSPYYAGSTDFTIKKGETTPVNIVCALANAKLKIVYTESFKKYFDIYSSSVSTSQGNVIIYEQAEERFAYFTPGKLVVNASVKKAGQANAAVYKVKEINAKAQHAYTLTLDVDAGSATMKVSFSEEVSQEDRVEFPVTDEALNAPAPYFKAQGFVSGELFPMIEGNVSDKKIYAYINAVGGIEGCMMTTASTLTDEGFPQSVDLANPGENAAVLEKYGLGLKGFSGNKDQMAMVDFTEFLSGLPAGEHVFTLSEATDRYGKTSTEPLVLKVTVTPCPFAIETTGEQLAFLSQECKIKLTYQTESPTYKGNPGKIHYYIKGESGNTDLTYVGADTLDNKNFIVTLKTPAAIKEAFQVTAGLSQEPVTTPTPFDVQCGITVDHEGDVWAKKVVFHLFNAACNEIHIQYQDGSEWKDAENVEQMADYQPGVGTLAAVHGLPSNKTFRFRALMHEDAEASNEVEVTTEEELQVPNSGFEDWYDVEVWYKTIFLSGGERIYSFYPYAKDASDRWWSTLNDKTTQEQSGVASWYYCAYPGTVPTNASSMHTASWHWNEHGGMSLSQGAYEGNTSMEIATVGYGANNWTNGGHGTDYRERGLLFIGTFDRSTQEQTLGHSFTSRPQKVQFYYKFYSYNNETTKAYAKLYDANKEEIGGGELQITQSTDVYIKGIFDISYSDEKKNAAYLTIVFMSTDADSPSTKDIQGSKGAWNAGYGDSRHVGSILTVDDVQLIYE